MEQSLSNLLGDAFSDLSGPLFPEGDLDFENLNFNVRFEEEEADRETDRALRQEGTGGKAAFCNSDSEDMYTAQSVDEDQLEDKRDAQGGRCPTQDDYTSSDEDREPNCSDSGGDEEEDMGTGDAPGDLLMSVCCSDEFGHEEDRTPAEGLPSAPQGAAVPQAGKVEQGDNESDEEVSYFERVPESGREMMPKSDRGSESLRLTQEENADSPTGSEPATATLEFPHISGQNLQDLIAEVDGEEYAERIKDFSGEEHEEAGESFADYPSDFSSCEYLEDGVLRLESDSQSSRSSLTSNTRSKENVRVEGAVMDVTWMGTEEDTDEQGGRYLPRKDLEMGADVFRSYDAGVTGEAEIAGNASAESESYSSSDDEAQERRREEELENDNKPEDAVLYSKGGGVSDDHHMLNNEAEPADFSINWDSEVLKTAYAMSEDLITAEDAERAETALSRVSQLPTEEINTGSVIEGEESKSTRPSYQGSLDDGFFFNTEVQALGITELGQLGDDDDDYDDDEERRWEQERIRAFFRFYNDSEGQVERDERQIKVQFSADHLSQVIHYETDSDSDSLSSSTGGEDEPSSAEASEEPKEAGDILPRTPAPRPPKTGLPQSEPGKDVSHRQICGRRHKCLNTLKSILKIGLVIVTGVLMFWLAAEQTDWLFSWV